MTSRSLLDSKFFDNLLINNLYVQNNLKVSGNFRPPKSFLFSIHYNNNNNTNPFNFNNINNTLSLSVNSLKSNTNIIQFTDRPFRDVKKINFNDFLNLFTPGKSFGIDHPNVVITSSTNQGVFTMKLDDSFTNFIFTPNQPQTLDLDSLYSSLSSFSIFVDTISAGGWPVAGAGFGDYQAGDADLSEKDYQIISDFTNTDSATAAATAEQLDNEVKEEDDEALSSADKVRKTVIKDAKDGEE